MEEETPQVTPGPVHPFQEFEGLKLTVRIVLPNESIETLTGNFHCCENPGLFQIDNHVRFTSHVTELEVVS